MKPRKFCFWGQSRYWWVLLIVGVILIVGGFCYWLFPEIGYAVASQLFGWMLVLAGVVQICVSGGVKQPRGWGWWLAGGIINTFIGFMLVRSVILSEMVLPYVLALIFIYCGVSYLCGAIMQRRRRYWWIGLINGILLLVIGFFFLEAGYLQNMLMVSLLATLAFIYWGFSLTMLAIDMRPGEDKAS